MQVGAVIHNSKPMMIWTMLLALQTFVQILSMVKEEQSMRMVVLHLNGIQMVMESLMEKIIALKLLLVIRFLPMVVLTNLHLSKIWMVMAIQVLTFSHSMNSQI